MGQIQTLQEGLSVFHLFLLYFSPWLPFLYFELFSKLPNKDDDYDDDRGNGINILVYQA